MGPMQSQESSEKEGRGRFDYRKNKGKVLMEAEIGEVLPQSRNASSLQELEEAQNAISPGASGRNQPC